MSETPQSFQPAAAPRTDAEPPGGPSPGDSIRPHGTEPATRTLSSFGGESIAPSQWIVDGTAPTVDLPHLKSTIQRTQPVPTSASFHLRRVVGRGGYGEVWEAVQSSLGRIVAVKRIRRDQLERAREERPLEAALIEAEFRQEAVTTAVLDHPNIVPVYDLGVDSTGSPLLAMKLVRGKSWSELIREDGRLPMPDLLARHLPILKQVAQAVAFAHSRGVIHRDLKPSQVMVGEFGEVILMDWGLAVSFLDARPEMLSGEVPLMTPATSAPFTSHASNPAGTPSFMAPEQTLPTGELLGPWTDVYLLGGVLYYILTFTAPHPGQHMPVVMQHAANGEVEPARQRSPDRDIPPELEDLCLRTLRREPRDRLPSAEAFIQALDDFISGSGRRRESLRLLDEARTLVGDVDSAREEALIRSFGPLEDSIAKWPGNAEARRLLEAARTRLDVVRATQARQRRNVLAGFALVVAGFLSLSVWQQGRNSAALDQIERQNANSARLSAINSLQARESALADRLSTLLPLPDSLLPDPDEAGFVERNRQRLAALQVERSALRAERIRLLALGLRLEPEPQALALAEANMLVRQGPGADRAAAAYRLYSAARGGPEPNIDALVGQGIAAARAGMFTSATVHLEEAASTIARLVGEENPRHARVIALAGEAYRNLDASGEAFRTYYRRSLGTLETQWVELSQAIADRHRSLGDTDRLLEFTSPALSLARRLDAPNGDLLAKALAGVADDLRERADYPRALATYEEALATLERAHGPGDPRSLPVRTAIAALLSDMGMYERAVEVARATLQDAVAAFGENSLQAFSARRGLATALNYSNQLAQSVEVMRPAVAYAEATWGRDHIYTSRAYNDLAVFLDSAGEHAEALKYYHMALESTRAIFGDDHPETASSYNNIGFVQQAARDYESAIVNFRKAWEIRRRTQGEDHPETAIVANNLGTSYHQAGDVSRGIAFMVRGFRPIRDMLGPGHPNTGMMLNNIAVSLIRIDRFEEGEPLQWLAAALLEGALPRGHPMYIDTVRNCVEAHLRAHVRTEPRMVLPFLRINADLIARQEAPRPMDRRAIARDYTFLMASTSRLLAELDPPRDADSLAYARRAAVLAELVDRGSTQTLAMSCLERMHRPWPQGELPRVPDASWPDRSQPVAMDALLAALDAVAPVPGLDWTRSEPWPAVADLTGPLDDLERRCNAIIEELARKGEDLAADEQAPVRDR